MPEIDFGFEGTAGAQSLDGTPGTTTTIDGGQGGEGGNQGTQGGQQGGEGSQGAQGSQGNQGGEGNGGNGSEGGSEGNGGEEGSTIELKEGTVIELDDKKYKVDAEGNLVDEEGKIFKEAKDVKEFIAGFDQSDDDSEINLETIQKLLDVEVTDENDKPIVYENTPEGIKSYIKDVIEISKNEIAEAAVNSVFEKYPVLTDVLNYYVANGNSLEGFNEISDRSKIELKDDDEEQQKAIIRTAWKENGKKGNVENYIAYLKSNDLLLATAKDELEDLIAADKAEREELERKAIEQEELTRKNLIAYWTGVKSTIDSKNIAGYKIPDTIIINRDGKNLSVTPNDFFNYLYLVDKNGKSQYVKDLEQDTPESRRDDEILRAYLKFTGGSYKSLVDMAIKEEEVKTLKLKSKNIKKSGIKITTPASNKTEGIEFGY